MLSRICKILSIAILIPYLASSFLFGGVRQVRSSNPTGSQVAVYPSYGAVAVTSYYPDYNGWAGTSAPGSMIPLGTILEYAPSSAVPVMVKGSRYYYENNVFLAEVFDGSSVVYQVVPAPVGAVVTQLPAGCIVRTYNGRSVQLCGNTYYHQVAGGYEVVAVQ